MSDVDKEKFLEYIKKVCEECGYWILNAEIRDTEYPYECLYDSVEWNGPYIEDGVEYRQSKAHDIQSAEWLLKRERIEEVDSEDRNNN